MKFKAEINIMPREELLDPQGKTVGKNLTKVGIDGVTNVRVGKKVHMEIEARDEDEARHKVDQACKKLLANQIMEDYDFTLKTPEEAGG